MHIKRTITACSDEYKDLIFKSTIRLRILKYNYRDYSTQKQWMESFL